MARFDVADLLGHVRISKCGLQLMKSYLDLNNLVAKIKKMLS